ncbi:hypothetical protein JCM8097_009024 [Rhodosporidiobolus ruineniae]
MFEPVDMSYSIPDHSDSIVILTVPRKAKSRLYEASPKVWVVNEQSGIVWAHSGSLPDNKRVLRYLQAQSFTTVAALADGASDVFYERLSHVHSRPLAVAGLLCGFDSPGSTASSTFNPSSGSSSISDSASTPQLSEPHLYFLLPDACCYRWSATAIGAGCTAAHKVLEAHWRKGMDTSEAIQLAVSSANVSKLGIEAVEVTLVERDAKIRTLTTSELSAYLPSPAASASSSSGRIALPMSEKDVERQGDEPGLSGLLSSFGRMMGGGQ